MNNKEYIENIQKRMIAYNEAREEAISFVLENGIKNTELTTHLLIIAHLWMADRMGEILTEQDINIFLNSETHKFDIELLEEIYLSEEDSKLDIYELLSRAVKIWYSDQESEE